MARQSFATALRAAARTLDSDGMPAAVDRRVRRRVRARVAAAVAAPVHRPRWLMVGGLAAAVTIAAVVFVLVGRGAPAHRGLAGFEILEASADLRAEPGAGGVLAVLAGSATVRSDEGEMIITTRTPARLRKERAGVRVIAGIVDISVARRRVGEPAAHVGVSHGSIEIRGTRFRVEQRVDGGEVRLDEGAIVFFADDGRRRELRPGDALSWPLPAEPAPRDVLIPVAPSGPASPAPEAAPPERPRPSQPPRSPSKRAEPSTPPEAGHGERAIAAPPAEATEVEPLFREIAELRARGQYRQAAEAIERRLDEPGIRDATRELMSFELVSILTYQLEDTARACAALARHVHAYPRSPHAAAVERARADLGCHGEPGPTPARREP